MNMLVHEYKNIDFFTNLSRETGNDNAVEACCRHLQYKENKKGERVFKQGTLGDLFYIILKGSVDVEIRDEDDYTRIVNTVHAGGTFGELALIRNQRRVATIRCREDCIFGVLSKDDYTRILLDLHKSWLYIVRGVLSKCVIFHEFSSKKIDRLSYFFTKMTTCQRDVIYRESKPADRLYIVSKGEFTLMKRLKIQGVSRLVEIAVLGEGMMLGAASMIEHSGYRYTCTCKSSRGELYWITLDQLLNNVNKVDIFKRMKERLEVQEAVRDERIEALLRATPEAEKAKSVLSPQYSANATRALRRSTLQPILNYNDYLLNSQTKSSRRSSLRVTKSQTLSTSLTSQINSLQSPNLSRLTNKT